MTQPNDWRTLEARLSHTLQSVRPDANFVHQVKQRFEPDSTRTILRAPKRLSPFVVIGSGILSISLLVLTLARVFYYLSGLSKKA